MTPKQIHEAAKEVRAFSESCPPLEQGFPSSSGSKASSVQWETEEPKIGKDMRTPIEILADWKAKILEERLSEKSCQKHGMPDQSKWHEGKADALERCADELEFLILPKVEAAAARLEIYLEAQRNIQTATSHMLYERLDQAALNLKMAGEKLRAIHDAKPSNDKSSATRPL